MTNKTDKMAKFMFFGGMILTLLILGVFISGSRCKYENTNKPKLNEHISCKLYSFDGDLLGEWTPKDYLLLDRKCRLYFDDRQISLRDGIVVIEKTQEK